MPRCPNPRCQADYPPDTVQCTKPFCRCLLPVALVAGRYRIETLIGIGGMGAVYRASDTFEMKQVALKILSLVFSTMDMPTAIERFRREARYVYQLRHHRNIVPVVNFGQDGDLLYLVMPLVTGGTLKALLKSEQPLPTQQAIGYVRDLAAAIDAVHSHPQQIVHRDIKPSNLLIHQDDGRLVLADFGIARAMQQEKALTQRGWALGTKHYVAPEQAQGNAQPSSDIYSMGVVVYQMFTGLLPFQALMRNQASELPVPSQLNHALPPTVDPVIMRAMETDAAKRYQSAGDFARDLANALLEEALFSAPTVTSSGMIATSSSNIITRTVAPENPCGKCGRENRSSSLFCRHCGQSLDKTSPIVTDGCLIGYISDIGLQARENEDMLLVIQGLCLGLDLPLYPFALFAIADGLRGPQGKSAGGHEASRLAVETVADIVVPQLVGTTRTHSLSTPGVNAPMPGADSGALRPARPPETILEQWMSDAVRQANQVIYHCNADYDTTMGSTLTTALLYRHRLYVAHVGDSRAYHYNAQKGLRLLTKDHTLAENLGEGNPLHPDEVYGSAKRNQHYRYLGQTYHLPVDRYQCDVEPNDLILICTDGLWHMVRDERLQELLVIGGDVQILVNLLVESAKSAGGEGNVSVILVLVQ